MTDTSAGKLSLEAQVYLNDSTLDDAQVSITHQRFCEGDRHAAWSFHTRVEVAAGLTVLL